MKRKEKIEYGAFCELYGESLRNLVVEYLLENKELDFAVGDMAEELNISRPKAYEIIKKLEKEGYVKKSRVVAGTQLFLLNEKSRKVKLLLKDFKECLRIVVEEYEEKPSSYVSTSSGIGVAAAAKHF